MRSRRMIQTRLAAELDGVSQSAISGWINGQSVPNHNVVFAIERALDVTPGFLSHHLGYIPAGTSPPCSVPDAVDADPLLDDVRRAALLALYRQFTLGE